MRIMLYNIGYSLGLNGSVEDYLLHSHRYIYCPRKTREKVMREISELVTRTKPDICTFLEISQHGPFLKGLNKLAGDLEQTFGCFDIENKYGQTSIFRRIAFFHEKCNAILSREEIVIRKHFLKAGMKKLVYELEYKPGFSIFVVHFALRRYIREQQMLELKKMIRGKEKVIVCGDFNIFGGTDEIKPLLRKTGLKLVNGKTDYTFPACQPSKTLDLFLCSKNITVSGLHVLPVLASDHLPVVIDIAV